MFGVVPKTLWEKRAAGRRAQPDPHGDAAAAGAQRRPRDDHRRRLRRQDGREERRHLRLRPAREPGRHAWRAAGDRGRRRRYRAGVAPALRSRRRLHRARRVGRGPAALSRTRATWSTTASGRTRRIRTSGTAPAISPRTTCRCRRRASSTAADDDQAIVPGIRVAPHRRPHPLSSDRLHRVGRQDGGVRRRSDADHGAHRRAVDHGLRPLSDGDARVQARVRRARRSSANT